MTIYIVSFLFSFFLAIGLTPIARKIAIKFQIVDSPSGRKVHHGAMPYLGGVSIYLSFSVPYILLVLVTDVVATNIGYALLIGGFIVFLTGLVDDCFDLKPIFKILGQLIASLVAVRFGLSVDVITLPFVGETINLGYFGTGLTIIWILAITNAVNLIDGLDGLASGVSFIAGLSLFAISLILGNVMTALLLLLFCGSLLGFLKDNFNPAKIFMGDAGSLFLGYFLAIISLLELKQVTVVSLLLPIIILGVPLSDTLYAMIRRKRNKQSILSPDKNHLHHCLLNNGLSHKHTVLVIYGISLSFALFAVLMVFLTNLVMWLSTLLVLGYFSFIHLFARRIGLMSYGVPTKTKTKTKTNM